jgi:glutaryl-CoA dehydrogenase (non-decarboxylating)
MAELGLLGICVPAEYGGAGMDYISLGLASEELEYVDTSLRVILSVHVGLNSLSLLAWGTEDQKRGISCRRPRAPEDRHLRPDGAGGRQRCPRHPDGGRPEGRSVRALGREDVDLARRRRRHFLVFAWTDLEKKRAGIRRA